MNADPGTITAILERVRAGDVDARAALAEQLYQELQRLAQRHMHGQRQDHTLQATALVHEVWMKLCQLKGLSAQSTNDDSPGFKDRAHFLTVASRAMRHVLVDHARRRGALRRDGGERRPLDDLLLRYEDRSGDLLEFEEVIERLRLFEPEMAQAVDLRFFGSASVDECAEILSMTRATFERRWTIARAWLRTELGGARV